MVNLLEDKQQTIGQLHSVRDATRSVILASSWTKPQHSCPAQHHPVLPNYQKLVVQSLWHHREPPTKHAKSNHPIVTVTALFHSKVDNKFSYPRLYPIGHHIANLLIYTWFFVMCSYKFTKMPTYSRREKIKTINLVRKHNVLGCVMFCYHALHIMINWVIN
jgi:hypothetical protein